MELAQALLDDRFFDQVKSFLASLHKLNSRSDQRREKDDKFAAEMDAFERDIEGLLGGTDSLAPHIGALNAYEPEHHTVESLSRRFPGHHKGPATKDELAALRVGIAKLAHDSKVAGNMHPYDWLATKVHTRRWGWVRARVHAIVAADQRECAELALQYLFGACMDEDEVDDEDDMADEEKAAEAIAATADVASGGIDPVAPVPTGWTPMSTCLNLAGEDIDQMDSTAWAELECIDEEPAAGDADGGADSSSTEEPAANDADGSADSSEEEEFFVPLRTTSTSSLWRRQLSSCPLYGAASLA